jgi:hypothetical protein
MNDRIVTRVVWLLALAFALACGAFALRIQMLDDAARSSAGAATATSGDGEALWRAHCARCHAPSEFTARLQGAQRFASFGELLRKLDRHGNLPLREDFEVIQWLASQPAARAESSTEDEEDDYSL